MNWSAIWHVIEVIGTLGVLVLIGDRIHCHLKHRRPR